jgi:type IV pilus assembly protein PilC
MAESKQCYEWTGINNQGKRAQGIIQATDAKEAQMELQKQKVEVITLAQKNKLSLKIFSRPKKIKQKDILLFTRYLSTMLTAGLSLVQALDIIAHDQENTTMQSLVIAIKKDISGGKTLAESFMVYPNHFSDLYCNLIKAGEKSGTLDTILARLANYLERSENLKRKVKKALVYPTAIIVVAMVVSLILLLFVVPQFQTMFKSFGAQLPLFTRIVVHLSEFFRQDWWIIIGLVVAAIIGIKRWAKKSDYLRRQWDKFSLKIIIIGPVLKKSIIARYTRTLAITLEAGMPIVESMKSMAPIMGNGIYSKAILQICADVTSGHQLSISMNSTKLFPNMAIQMIAVGEASGALANMLNKVADYYEEEVNNLVENLSSLLEPLIMAILGIIIGGFVIAMYLPIFKIGSLF